MNLAEQCATADPLWPQVVGVVILFALIAWLAWLVRPR